MKHVFSNTMVTIFTTLLTVNGIAQHRYRGNEPMASNNGNSSNQKINGNSNQKQYGNYNNGWHPNVSIHIGGGQGNYYGQHYNHHYYSSKKAAYYALKKSANVIKEALQFSNWNDMYSPWLAKAIRHQQYAKQQYYWGNYAGAINHSERAGFLAWSTLSYFNNQVGYQNNGFNNYNDDFGYEHYQDPYQNPNNPYYRKVTTNADNSVNTNNEQPNSNSEYRMAKEKSTDSDLNVKNSEMKNGINKMEIDDQLPEAKLNDKNLLKVNANELDIE